jgi:hypothetical protein
MGNPVYHAYYDPQSWALLFIPGPREERDYLGGETNVFVCGGLQQPERMASIVGRSPPFAPAVARGFRRAWIEVGKERVSFMLDCPEAPDRILTGVVWLGLSEEEIGRIESFELKEGLRKTVAVEVAVGERTVKARTYVKR